MTRENKLALIVAFALILGVSVLLSDHLSSARTAVPGQVQETNRLPSIPQRPIRTLDDVIREAGMASPGRGPATSPATEPTNQTQLSGTGESGRSPIDGLLEAVRNAPVALGTERSAERPREARGPIALSGEGDPVVIQQRLPSAEESRRARAIGQTPAPGTPSPAEAVRNHPVRSGESLFAIAAKYYGDGSLWRELARYNGDRVKPDGTVNAGVMLRVPSRAELTGKPDVPVAAPATAPPSTPPPSTPRPSRARSYTVAAGDTLGDISLSTLGTSRRWREIYELNRERIPDPNHVRTGTVLVLPAS